MRILFLESHPMWIHGLPNGFRDAGHEVFVSGPITDENLPKMVSDYNPDFIMTMGWGQENSSIQKQDMVRKYIGNSAIPHIYWATEDPTHTEYFTLPFLQRVQPDFVFTICQSKVNFYRQLGIKAAHLDFAYHSSVHHETDPKEEYQNKISLVANAYPNKMRIHPRHYRHQSMKILIEPLIKENIRIDFYGTNWDKMEDILGFKIPQDWIHGAIHYTEANQVYSSADIIIGLQNHRTQLTQRTYEIMGSGGFLLTNNTPEINRHFKAGTELLTSNSPEETLELVQYHLKHPGIGRRIRDHAKKAVEKHSYKHRAEYVLKILESEGIKKGQKLTYQIKPIKTDFIHEKWQLYTVCNGDTLWGISRNFGVPIEQIKSLNGLSTDYIEAGQLLKLKQLNDLQPSSSSPSSILVQKGESHKKQIALTYDAGDGADGASLLLDVLKKHQVRTTFFLTGEWVEKYPDLACRIVNEGHEIGNHSYSHPNFTTLTQEAIMDELKKTEDIISQITGKDCRPLFRPPYGAWSKNVLDAVGKAGYLYSIYWSLDTIDWKRPPAEAIVKKVIDKANGDDIVLMHLEYLHTALATDMMIPKLGEAGFQFSILSDLLRPSQS